MGEIKEGILEKFQDYVRRQLISSSELCPIYISPKKGNLESWIDFSVREQINLGIFILTPIPQKIVEGIPGPVWSNISIDIRVVENTNLNTSHRSCVYIAEKLAHKLHCMDINFDGWQGKLLLKESGAWDYSSEPEITTVTLHFESFFSMD